MSPYTVLLLRPDYLANSATDCDSYLAHVEAETSIGAVAEARDKIWADDNYLVQDLTDYTVIAVFEGHLIDLNPEM